MGGQPGRPLSANCQEVFRLGVDMHHAQVVADNLLAIRVFRERFPYFKYFRAKSNISLLLFSKRQLQERLFSLEDF